MLKIFGIRNKKKTYVLMHKNVAVLAGDYDSQKASFNAITEVFSYDHVPYSARENGSVSLEHLNHWLRWRGIPGYRVGLDRLLSRLEVESPRELLSKYYGLSVSDHYWLREEEEQFSYDSVNFFHHSFDQDGFGRAMFAFGKVDVTSSARRTPNNTLAGYQKKAWFHRNNELVLFKGGSFLYQMEPINEMIASVMAKRLGMDAVPYTTEIYESQLVSVCPNMLDMNHELITADDVLAVHVPPADRFHFNDYVSILKEMGIANASKCMDDMLVLDFLMMNTDRHNQNFGVIINADTMKWEKVAPIFDTGTGLACLKFDDELKTWPADYRYRLFNAKEISDKALISLIQNIERYDFSVLDDIPDIYAKQMHKYQMITNMSNPRIEAQKRLLGWRIRLLKQVQLRKSK